MMSDGHQLKVVIDDSGIPFDPTIEKKADITLSAEERRVGGLGILLVRELMDTINYEHVNGHNILTLTKKINM
jgi:anti-sigma regulatory factor (Ser/Thr protein kinase)